MNTAESRGATGNGGTSHRNTANGNTTNGSTTNGSATISSAMFSGASAGVQAGGQKPETEQLNMRIRADLYRQLDRMSVILGARRGVPTNRVTVVEEALAAYFEANRTG
ncbi:MAG TPA: hypothetical protein VF714_07390 [Jatrophihabitans sp.]